MLSRTVMIVLALCGMASFMPASFGADVAQRNRSVLAGVKELEKPVSYTETKIPLGELIQKVAEETGVSLSASRDVADEPVAVVVKEFPARELLEQAADLLGYRWRKSAVRSMGDRGPRTGGSRAGSPSPVSTPRYEIYQDLAGKAAEDTLRQAAVADVERQLRQELDRYTEIAAFSPEQIQAIVDGAEQRRKELAKLSPEQQQALRDSPAEKERERRAEIARSLLYPIDRSLARTLAGLSPGQWGLLLRQGGIVLSDDPQQGESRLPPAISRAFHAARPVLVRPGWVLTFSEAGAIVPPGTARWDELARQSEKEMQEQWAAASGYRVRVRVSNERFQTRGTLSLEASVYPFRTGAPIGNPVAGSNRLTVGTGPVDPLERAEETTPERQAALMADPILGSRRPFKPTVKPHPAPDGPGSSSAWRLRELLPELGRTYGVDILSDAYWEYPSLGPDRLGASEPAALFALLDRLAGSARRWDRRGSLIRLRSRWWFFERPREVPLRLARRWQALFDERGALPMEEHVAMVRMLTESQLEGLGTAGAEMEFPFDFGFVSADRQVLRLYGALSPAQQQALWQGNQVPVARMAPAAQALFLAALQERRRSSAAPMELSRWAGGNLSLTSERFTRVRERRDGAVTYAREPAPPPGGAPPPVTGPAPPAATPATPRATVARYLVIDARFHLRYAPDTRDAGFSLTVTPP